MSRRAARTLAVLLAAATASPAFAQSPLGRPLPPAPYAGLQRNNDAVLSADRLALRQREVALQNQLAAEADRARANQAVGDLKAAVARPDIPTVPYNRKAPPPVIEMSQFAEIPNATLAASNARALAASQNRK